MEGICDYALEKKLLLDNFNLCCLLATPLGYPKIIFYLILKTNR